MTIDSYQCAQCPWSADGSKADDQADAHWKATRHFIDTVPPAETDYSGYETRQMRYVDLDTVDAGDPDVRRSEQLHGYWDDRAECDEVGRFGPR